jgi:PKD domain
MINKTLRFIMTTKGINRIVLVLALLLASVNIASAQSLNPAIVTQPGVNVEVGEEVFFSAKGTTYTLNPTLLQKASYRWEFGDGYACKQGSGITGQPYYYINCQSIAVTHYFMKPGDYPVKLTVTVYDKWGAEGGGIAPAVATGEVTTVVHVTGEAPMAGFEIQHAPFQNRLAQYLYVTIPAAYRRNQTTLRITLAGAKGSRSTLLSKNNLAIEERIYLDHKPLVQDDYVVIAELLTNGQRIPGGIWRDKFSKRYPTIPKVGIDENNSFLLNGALFFPIGPFMSGVGTFGGKMISLAHVNMLHTEDYYETHTPATWKDYLDQAKKAGLVAIGPARGDYGINFAPAAANYWQFNHAPDQMAKYIQTNKGSSAMFAWSWQDEPSLGGWGSKVYVPTLAAWGYVGHREDPHHPSFNLMYGYDWSKYYGNVPNIYDYLGSAWFFGGKKWVQDAIPFDIYPIGARLHPSMNFVDMGPYAAYLDALDRIQSNNKNLVPVLPCVQPCDERAGDPLRTHTDAQVYLEAWMNVIHGAKGIIWFPHFDMANSGRWTAMKKFTDQMAILAPIVLGPEPARTVKDDANAPLKRVDTMIREKDGKVYVFAARVTEPDPIKEAKYQGVEPDSIMVNFTASGLTGNFTAEVVDEGRTVSLTDGKFTDTCVKNAVHIYKIVIHPPAT